MSTVHHAATLGRESQSILRFDPVAAAAAGGYLVLGLVLATRTGFWGDEAFTATAIRLPLPDLLSMLTRIDVNMGAYYLAAKAWTAVFGTSEIALRSLSLVLAAATVWLGGRLVSSWYGPRAGVAMAVTLAVNPFFLLVGLTARPYAMLALLTLGGVALLVRALGRADTASWVVLALVDVVALYTSLLAGLAIIAQGVILLVVHGWRLRRQHWLAGAIVLVGSLPTVLYIQPAGTLSWITGPTITGVLQQVLFSAGAVVWLLAIPLVLWGVLLPPTASGGGLASLRHGRWVLPIAVVVPLAMMLALLPVQSLFAEFYLVVATVPAALLVGAVVGARGRRVAIVLTACLFVLGLAGIVRSVLPQPALVDQQWAATIAYLDQHVEPGDAVVFPNTYYRIAAEYYGHGSRAFSVTVPRLPDDPWFSQPPDTYDRLKRTNAYDAAAVSAGVDGVDRVWFVDASADQYLSTFTEALQSDGWKVAQDSEPAGMPVRLLVRSP